MSGTILEALKLRVSVPGRVLVDDFDSVLRGGEFIALLGGNGTGKSLMLRTLAGLRSASGGEVRLDGQHIGAQPRRHVATRLGFLPQDPDAPPQGSLFESVLLGRFAHLGFWERNGPGDEQRAARALADVDLATLGARELASLSGGEQRRAAIARLLVQAPRIYLLDEPTNHLDPAQQLGILGHLRGLAQAGATVVASLHDPNLALRFAGRVWLLSGRGPIESLACGELQPQHLARLYGVDYVQGQLGDQRFMAAVSAAHNR